MVDFGAPGDVIQAEAQSRSNPKPRSRSVRSFGARASLIPSSPSAGHLTGSLRSTSINQCKGAGSFAQCKEGPHNKALYRTRRYMVGHQGALVRYAVWHGGYGMAAHGMAAHGIASAARSRQVRCALRCMWCGHAALFQLRRCANAQPVMLHACAVMATRWPCAVMARRSWRCGHGVPWLRRESAVLAARAI